MPDFSNPAGSDRQVNVASEDVQLADSRRAIAISGTGRSVVVWQAFEDGTAQDIFARLLDASGVPQGSVAIEVNTIKTGKQDNAAVAMDALGNFVVVWESFSADGQNDIYARRFNAQGQALGSEFLIHPSDTDPFNAIDQRAANIAMLPNGGFVVTWMSLNQDGDRQGIYARRFNAQGQAAGDPVLVNTTTTGNQRNANIAVSADGSFVIAWISEGQVARTDIFFQRFNSDGTRRGTETRANQFTTDLQEEVSVAIAANGDFILTWADISQDKSGWGVYARSYRADGTAKGDEFLVNSTTANDQRLPAVAMQPNGGFVIAWTAPDGNSNGIFARRYSAAGVPQGKEFLVNSDISGIQRNASIALEADGDAVFTWSGANASTIVSRRFNLSELPSTAGVANLTLPENSGNYVINLKEVFSDAETANLSYEIISISNRALFEDGEPILNLADGKLTLDFSVDTSGFSDLTLRATDQDGLSVETSFRVTLTPVSNPPVVNLAAGKLAYSENGSPVLIDSSLTVSDPDSDNLAKATVTIADFAIGDVLNVDRALAQTYGLRVNSSNGILTITGTATTLQYQGLLKTLAYSSTSDSPRAGDRTIRLQVNDGSLDSNVDSRIVTVTPINDAPAVTIASGSLSYTEGDAALPIDAALAVRDVDSLNLTGATVTIVNFAANSGDVLTAAANQFGITSSYRNGVLTLTGSATVEQYQAVLQSIAYANSSDNPTVGDRTIRLIVSDGQLNSAPVDRTIRVVPVNEPPVITLTNAPLSYTEDRAAVAFAADLTIRDPDSSNLTRATVTIANFATGDTLDLAVPTGANLTKTVSNGVLTLSGTASLATYQAALRSLSFRSVGNNPTAGARTIQLVLSDEFETGTPVSRTITVVPVNDAPVVAASGTVTYSENS